MTGAIAIWSKISYWKNLFSLSYDQFCSTGEQEQGDKRKEIIEGHRCTICLRWRSHAPTRSATFALISRAVWLIIGSLSLPLSKNSPFQNLGKHQALGTAPSLWQRCQKHVQQWLRQILPTGTYLACFSLSPQTAHWPYLRRIRNSLWTDEKQSGKEWKGRQTSANSPYHLHLRACCYFLF